MDVEELFSKHQAALLRYLTRYTGDADAAADAVQHVYLRLLESPPRDDNNLKSWLFTVATNVVRDGWRREKVEERLRDAPERARTETQAPDPHGQVERKERILIARQMLTRVSERERTVLLMWVEGFAHQEIAEAVGTTVGTIGPTIARALKKMSKHIDEFLQEDV